MEYKVILIQGAMNIEIEYLINQLKEKEKIVIAEYNSSLLSSLLSCLLLHAPWFAFLQLHLLLRI